MIDRIYCKNFRRIEEADIQLKDGITCVVGNNGTGKSSLIEVIPFNLYGKVKSGTKKDSVRRRGAAEDDPTFTVVDFSINGTHYRCRRYYTKKMSLMATLYSYTEDEYAKLLEQADITELDKSLGTEIASSTTGVTNAIGDILATPYEGFKASFIAQQKELDALATLTQENRKKFFLNLLGYDKLDTLKPEISRALRALESSVNVIERQNLSAVEIGKEIGGLTKQAEVLAGRIAKGRATVQKTENEANELAVQAEQAHSSSEKVEAALADLETLEEEKVTLESDIQGLIAQIQRDEAASKGYDESSSLSMRIAQLKDKIEKAYLFKQTSATAEKMMAAVAVKTEQYNATQVEIEKLRLKTAVEPDLEKAQQAFTSAKEQKASVRAQSGEVAKRLAAMQELIASVEAGEVGKCPTCGNEISSAEGREHLNGEAELLRSSCDDIALKDAECDKLLAKREEELAEMRARSRTWQKDLNEKTKLEQRNEVVRQEIETAKEQAEAQRTAAEEYRAMMVPDEQLREMEEQLVMLNEALGRENEMKTAFYRAKQNNEKLAMSNQRLHTVVESIAAKKALVKEHRPIAAKFDSLSKKKNDKAFQLERYRNAVTDLEREHAATEASLAAARGNLKIAEEQSKQLASLKEEIEAHIGAQQVVEMLRRNLPSRIAPRLALEASHLLDIATAGAYNMIEIDDSYEVYVYTDDDIRPIAQMSGGESDVISLCIRIGIAKLLLESSGIPSQTFILDEIFGALDDSRKESTCLALQNIGEQLSKILCITHVDEIKDMADWTYIVEMDEHGVSHVRELVDPLLEAETEGEALAD